MIPALENFRSLWEPGYEDDIIEKVSAAVDGQCGPTCQESDFSKAFPRRASVSLRASRPVFLKLPLPLA